MPMLSPKEQTQLEQIIKKMVTLPVDKCKVTVCFAFDSDHKIGLYPDVTVFQKRVSLKM